MGGGVPGGFGGEKNPPPPRPPPGGGRGQGHGAGGTGGDQPHVWRGGTQGSMRAFKEVPMRVTICLATAVLLAGAAPAPAVAQGNTSAADTREVVAYRLSMQKLQQLNRAMADLQRQRDADPAYQQLQKKKQEFAALSEKEEPTEAEMARMARLEEEIDAAEPAEEEPED